MDPDTNLEETRRLVRRLNVDAPDLDDVNELVLHVEAMDQWLKHGGSLPRAWNQSGARCTK